MDLFFSEVDGDVTVIRLDGGLDATTAPELTDSLTKIINSGIRRIILDCEPLTYMSSAGIGALIRLHKQMAKLDGDVKIAALQGPVAAVLNTMSIGELVSIYPDVSRARLAFRPPDAK